MIIIFTYITDVFAMELQSTGTEAEAERDIMPSLARNDFHTAGQQQK